MKLRPENKNAYGTHIYYMVWCDDSKAPEGIDTDMMFELYEFQEMVDYIKVITDNNCEYSVMIEIWNEDDERIVERIYLKEIEE